MENLTSVGIKIDNWLKFGRYATEGTCKKSLLVFFLPDCTVLFSGTSEKAKFGRQPQKPDVAVN